MPQQQCPSYEQLREPRKEDAPDESAGYSAGEDEVVILRESGACSLEGDIRIAHFVKVLRADSVHENVVRRVEVEAFLDLRVRRDIQMH